MILEREVGGRLFERTSSGVEHQWGRVTTWEPPRRFGYLWHIRRDATDATDVEISFTEVDNGRTRGEHIVISVEDAGGGIPENDLPKIFEPGWRASPARTPEAIWPHSSGAGLGLAIVHGIVEAHAGEVTVSNVPGGCRFDVTLPGYEPAAP